MMRYSKMNLIQLIVASYLVSRTTSDIFAIHRHKSRNLNKNKEMNELITFHLCNNDGTTEELHSNNLLTLSMSNFQRKRRTKFIIHDWLDDMTSDWLQEMAEAMANRKRWNVILVNWSPLSYTFYSEAYEHMLLAAETLANFTIFLNKYGGQPLMGFHYIAHGHGIKIASKAASIIKEKSRFGRMIYRLTVLDPLKEIGRSNQALAADSERLVKLANFVDVIHTSGGGIGNMSSIGHVDYYPNGGKHQPDCGSSYCSHVKVYELWKKSIENPNIFKAYNYKSWDDYLDKKKLRPVPMGIASNKGIPSGNYYLET